jgi:Domain of unknown function (DUF4132)
MSPLRESLAAKLVAPDQEYSPLRPPTVDLTGLTSLELGSLCPLIDRTRHGRSSFYLALAIRNAAFTLGLVPTMDPDTCLEALRGADHIIPALEYLSYLDGDLPAGSVPELRKIAGTPGHWEMYPYQAYPLARLAGEPTLRELRQVVSKKFADSPLRLQEYALLEQLSPAALLALAAADAVFYHGLWPSTEAFFKRDAAIALAKEPAYAEFSHGALTYAVTRIEDIHGGKIEYQSDKAYSSHDCALIGRAARVAALRNEPWFGEIIHRLLPKVCLAPTNAKTVPSQSLAIALGHATEAAPTPEGVQALREAIRVVRHAGVKKKLSRHIKPAERALVERSDIMREAPDLGLDQTGSLLLDFGPRTFVVAFDETLSVFVKDAQGQRLKDLPKPNKGDDEAKAEAAVTRYKQLKKEAKAVVSQQVTLLELGMAARKRWTTAQFDSFFLHHPLMRHLAARLVWGVYGDAVLTGCFRVAEDWTLADQNDTQYTLGNDAVVGVAHVLEMPESVLSAFGQVFGDYSILQPFKQLGRETYALREAEHGASTLNRYKDKTVSTGSLMGLLNRGWKRGESQDGGIIYTFHKRVGTDLELDLALDPGVFVGSMTSMGNQSFPELALRKHGIGGPSVPFSSLDSITVSEILRDFELLNPVSE